MGPVVFRDHRLVLLAGELNLRVGAQEVGYQVRVFQVQVRWFGCLGDWEVAGGGHISEVFIRDMREVHICVRPCSHPN